MYNNIKYEVKDGIAFVTINRPKAMNALNEEVLTELYDAFTGFAKDSEAKAAIVTGEGKAFVAGADIEAMSKMNTMEGRAMGALGHSVMNLIESIEKPVIAAVNGFALGGGCELSMACDIRIAGEKAQFGQPEVGLGIIPGFGGTQRLSRLVGKGNAKYLIMTADIIDAAEAFRMGLVQKVVPQEELMQVAEKTTRKIMSKAPIAISVAKKTIDTGYDIDMKNASSLEIEAFAGNFSTEDQVEGMTAFLEKRKPEFKNK